MRLKLSEIRYGIRLGCCISLEFPLGILQVPQKKVHAYECMSKCGPGLAKGSSSPGSALRVCSVFWVYRVFRVCRVCGVFRVHRVFRVYRVCSVFRVHSVFRVYRVFSVFRVYWVFRVYRVIGCIGFRVLSPQKMQNWRTIDVIGGRWGFGRADMSFCLIERSLKQSV